jgi:hypothetical protein
VAELLEVLRAGWGLDVFLQRVSGVQFEKVEKVLPSMGVLQVVLVELQELHVWAVLLGVLEVWARYHSFVV